MKYAIAFLSFFVFSVAGIAQGLEDPDTMPQHSIIEEFQKFFDNEIKKQGVKGNWIFKLNEITSVHKFDYDSDGYLDTLMEFNAVPVEGGGVTYYYVVLFQNNSREGVNYMNYMVTEGLIFEKFDLGNFYFKESEQNRSESSQVYQFVERKFLKVLEKG